MELKSCTWQDVAQSVKQENKELFDAIEDIVSVDDVFYEGTYCYGENILLNGKVQTNGILDDLNYAHIPLSIVLSNNVELYIDNSTRTIPLNLLHQGDIFGTYEILDALCNINAKPLWSITAGSKSIFCLQKLTEVSRLKKLQQHFHLKNDIFPATYHHHYHLFKAIAESQSWTCKILFFPKSIVEPVIKRKPSHHLLTDFITQYSWKSVNSSVEMMKNSLHWEKLSLTLSQYNIKLDQQHIETLKHLIQIHKGKAPAFRVSTSMDAPIDEIKYALSEIYQCRYPPDIISLAGTAESSTVKSVYYSFLHPTLLDGNVVLSENLRSYYAFCEKISYTLNCINHNNKDMPLPINIYSSKKDIYDNKLVRSSHEIGIDITTDNLSSSRFFRACAEVIF